MVSHIVYFYILDFKDIITIDAKRKKYKNMPITYIFKNFEGLTHKELIDMLRIRSEIFVVEQNCPYLDIDGYDEIAMHLLAKDKGVIIGCLRILPAGRYPDVSIGRVVVKPEYRRQGIAKIMLDMAVEEALRRFSCSRIMLGSQVYAEELYESAGFKKIGEEYLEDGIPHVHMVYTKE